MIVKVDADNMIKGSFQGVFNYHEERKADTTEMVYSNIGTGLSTQERVSYYDMIARLNSRTTTDGLDIPFTFHPDDELSDSTFMNIWSEWRDAMGIDEDRPITIYRHHDTDNQHYHVVLTNCDEMGKPLKFLGELYKKDNVALCRNLERKYGLKVADKKSESKNYNLDLAQRYAFCNGIKKAKSRGVLQTTTDLYFDHFGDSDNVEPETIIDVLGQQWYNDAYHTLDKNELIYKSKKQQLVEKLDKYRFKANSRLEYIQYIEGDKDLYVRKFGKPGAYFYKYGLKKKAFNVKEYKLPARFGYDKIGALSEQKAHSYSQQSKYILSSIEKSLRSSDTYGDFKTTLLSKYGIRITEHSNSKGIYGIDYRSTKIAEPLIFKASEFELFSGKRKATYNGIDGYFKFKEQKTLKDEGLNKTRELVLSAVQQAGNKRHFYELLAGVGVNLSRQDGTKCFATSSEGTKVFFTKKELLGELSLSDLETALELQTEETEPEEYSPLPSVKDIQNHIRHSIQTESHQDDTRNIIGNKRKSKDLNI